MDDKLKKLHIKKLIQEYNFLSTEDEYRKEVVDQNKTSFLDAVQEIRKKLDIPIQEPKVFDNKEIKNEVLKNTKPENVSESTKSKVKKIYREIVKITHPDRTNSKDLVEFYIKATIAADNFNILDLFRICIELKIQIELDMEDVDVLNFLIKNKKDEIEKIEVSFIWLWLNTKTEEEKDKIVEMFIKQTS